jgi:calcineurin-like phosphoesterase family protein
MAFVISDTHFFHDKLITFQRGQFKCGEEMNAVLEKQWNSIVGKTDRVFHLGDFAFGSDLDAIEKLILRLKGRVYLMVGNHDTPAKISLYQKYFKVFSGYKEDKIIMTHFPVHPILLEENRPRSDGTLERYNLHGHLHMGFVKDARYFNANWDRENKIYTPSEIKKYFRQE